MINVENKRESIVKKQTKDKQETGGNMNDMLFRTLLKRYEALIEDSLYKIQSLNENNIIIPEHIDITGEVDKLLEIIAGAEDKLAAMRKYYGKSKAEKKYSVGSQKGSQGCFTLRKKGLNLRSAKVHVKQKCIRKLQKCIRKTKSAKVRGHSARVPRRFCEG